MLFSQCGMAHNATDVVMLNRVWLRAPNTKLFHYLFVVHFKKRSLSCCKLRKKCFELHCFLWMYNSQIKFLIYQTNKFYWNNLCIASIAQTTINEVKFEAIMNFITVGWRALIVAKRYEHKIVILFNNFIASIYKLQWRTQGSSGKNERIWMWKETFQA